MQRRSDDPAYQMHEPPQPAGVQEERLSAEDHRERSVAAENTPRQVQVRRNTGMPAPSQVREGADEE